MLGSHSNLTLICGTSTRGAKVQRTSLAMILVVVLSLLSDILTRPDTSTVISAHLDSDFRCSHVPLPPEPVNHVWLDNVTFTETSAPGTNHRSAGNQIRSGQENGSNDDEQSDRDARSRRHIDTSSDPSISTTSEPIPEMSPDSITNSLWNLIKRLEQPLHSSSSPSSPSSSTKIDRTRDSLVPMRIQVHYDSSVHELEKKKFQSISENVIPTVVKFFEEVLLIRREYTIDRFRIARRCPNNTIYYAKESVGPSRPYCMERCEDHAVCGEMIVPKEHLSACSYCNTTSRRCTTNYASEGKGVANTQLLLYVSAKQTTRCKKDQTIAYAAHCAQDTKTDRPVAGHANLCPSSISTDPKDLKALIATVKHELTHVLGFSVSLFAYYRDQQGRPLTERDSYPGPIPIDPKTGYARWSERIIRKLVRPNWSTGEGLVDKEVHVVVTPTVVREVRRHFNCSSLEGAELEDQGSDGTSMTHWEKRLFENEAMTGTHTQNSVYSRITLAVLQDTGWYVANFTNADKLEWGRDLGCDFAKKSCKAWIDERRAKRQSIRPFCDRIKGELLQISCTEDRSSKAVCNMRHYKEPLPGLYQNFDQLDETQADQLAHFGGSVDLADYCPFIQEFTWQVHNVTVRGSRCDLGGNSVESDKNAALEHYGFDARCFEHGRRWEQRSCTHKRHWHHFGAGCYKYACANGHLNVLVGSQSYPCYYPDQMVHVEQMVDHWFYNGSLICPACEKVCSPAKCATYDSRLVDQILSIGFVNNTDETLRAMLDESLNGIDTRGDTIEFKKSYHKYKSIMEESNQSFKRRKAQHLLEIDAEAIPLGLLRKHSTMRTTLVCSGGHRGPQPSAIALILALLSFAMIY